MRNGDKKKTPYYMDYTIVIAILLLFGIGLIMIYSTSSYEATIHNDDASFYLKKQALAGLIGIIFMIVVSFFDYHIYQKLYLLAIVISVGVILLIIPFGKTLNGARRWIDIGFGVSFQPAEAVKLLMIVYVAAMVTKAGSKSIETFKTFLVIMMWPLILAVMVWKITDNLSSAIIIVGISAAMIFVATKNYRMYVLLGSIAAAGAAGMIFWIKSHANVEESGFRAARVLAWMDPESYASGKGYQTVQALYAIGSGGIFGKGLGESMQKLGFIPEAQNDMIFSILCEEMGLAGAIIMLALFFFLIFRCMIVAYNAPDMFGGFLIIGVIAHIAIQVFLNIAVVTNLIPNTGISLPFISYGGTSIVFLFIEMGLVFAVSRQIKLAE